jgi:hypothetical protein
MAGGDPVCGLNIRNPIALILHSANVFYYTPDQLVLSHSTLLQASSAQILSKNEHDVCHVTLWQGRADNRG